MYLYIYSLYLRYKFEKKNKRSLFDIQYCPVRWFLNLTTLHIHAQIEAASKKKNIYISLKL